MDPGKCRFETGRSPSDRIRLRSYCPGSVAQGKRATPYEGVRGGSIPPGPARGSRARSPLIATHGAVAELVDAPHSDCGARNGREGSTLSEITAGLSGFLH
jgi:hypothetical protein